VADRYTSEKEESKILETTTKVHADHFTRVLLISGVSTWKRQIDTRALHVSLLVKAGALRCTQGACHREETDRELSGGTSIRGRGGEGSIYILLKRALMIGLARSSIMALS
jgi:hypothetical protein